MLLSQSAEMASVQKLKMDWLLIEVKKNKTYIYVLDLGQTEENENISQTWSISV